MKLLAYVGAVGVALLLANSALAQDRTAIIGGNSRSLYFGPFQRTDLSGRSLATYFTTYDGTAGTPLYQPIGTTALFSGEVRQRTNDVNTYEADFVTYMQGTASEYGSAIFGLPTADGDGNGLPDICQSNRAVNLTGFTGTFASDWPFPRSDFVTLSLSRLSNQVAGTYTMRLNSEPNAGSGVFQSANISGSVGYNRTQGTISFTFAITDPPVLQVGQSRTVTGSTTYTANNPNQIIVPQFSVSGGGVTYTVQGGLVLNRSGSRYTGNATLSDGVPETSWRDYVDWVIEINDPNDWDANGIPDISDTIPNPPFILTPPQSHTAILSSNTTFTVSASGSQPLSYQWQEHGTNKPGATSSTMTLTNAQLADAGEYRAIVSNGGGSVTSQVAVLTVIFPPSITDPPQPLSVIAGESAQFDVAATGSDPIYYQWRKGTTNVPGEAFAILYIQSVQAGHEGDYSVVVSNAAGIAISSPVHLSVTVPPAITNQPRSQSVETNVTVTFSAGVSGTLPTIRWMHDGTNVPGGNSSTLVLPNARPQHQGTYTMIASNRGGIAMTLPVQLYVGWPLALTNFVHAPDGSFARMDLIGRGSSNYVLQASFNVTNWTSMATNTATNGLTSFTESFASGPAPPNRRFYKVKVQ